MNEYALNGFFDELEQIEKVAGLLRPEQPRARDIIKGRGPEKRRARTALRDKLRAGCPTADLEKDAGQGKKLLTGGLLAATLAGGGKAMSKNVAKAGLGSGRAAIAQSVKKAPSNLRMGGATSQARRLKNMGILPKR